MNRNVKINKALLNKSTLSYLSPISRWYVPVAKNPKTERTWVVTGMAWFRHVGLCNAGPSSAHRSKSMALGNLKRLISHSSSWARKSS